MKDKGVIWLFGGGLMQIPMATEIKDRGYQLLITDLNPDCPCRALADRFEPVSIYDAGGNLTLARQLDFHPAAVLTVATDAGIEVSTVAHYFGLPAAPPEVAKVVRNKAMMRGKLAELSPPFRAGVTYSQFTDWNTFPCVVKAADNSGSKGFSVVRSRDELPAALKKARQNNRYGINTVLVEAYLDGVDVMPELTDFSTCEAAVEGFMIDGGWIYANGALRLFHRNKPGIEAGHFNPFVPSDEVVETINRAAKLLGVTEGPLKFDLMNTKDGWKILECATRLSGGWDHAFTSPLATGRDVTGFMLDYALGLAPDYNKLIDKRHRHTCCYAPIYEPGKITGWVNETGNDSGVFYTTGGEIKPLESNQGRPVFIIRDGATREEALDRCLEMAGKIRPLYRGE